MIFRNATLEDLPEIVAIYNTTIAGRMVTADTEPVTVESRIPWFNVHNPEKRPLWMVEDEGKTIGWVSFQSFYGRPAYDGTAEISIYLREDARGKGYGKTILRYAMEQCPVIKINTLLGFIFSHNLPSIKLFEQMGFKEWAHLPDIAVLDGVERSLSILGKRVG
ncbi:GNAT family N-acetyltransferase [Chitinophaga tropicalis]|uniref:GNAT family N-acetyltransferase n=1 Tax=Chitinophaga tropicalis TaxID=2683588 RepID=A0A7K1UCR7_9BACT|nr:GNAT family N-acetyltransferase [Chitinophaga tropicalis]MVT12172.1 GNAT family N-acetyltransferase [Chitinophaga tropicalis]